MRRQARVAALLLLAAVLTGCAPAGSPAPDATAGAEEPVVVLAAASLQASFDELAEEFAARHPEHSVAPIRYDGSPALAAQLLDGADADVVAFANESSYAPLVEAGAVGEGELFAANTLRIAVAPGNPKGVRELADLADPALTVVLCAPEVPCGDAARRLLADAGVVVTPVSEETNVTSVVRRVAGGEADAGLVYATDVHDAGDALEGILPENADAVVNRYPIGLTPSASEAAAAFVDFVLSDEGQRILAAHGFEAP